MSSPQLAIRAVKSLKRRILSPLHLGTPRQVLRFEPTGTETKGRVLLIGPALVPIPAPGWGAVETIISEQAEEFAKQGFHVTVLNSARWADWYRARVWQFESVIIHYEPWVRRARLFRRFSGCQLIAYSHYGLLEFPEKWSRTYGSLLRQVLRCDVAVALNPRIARLMQEQPKRKAEVLLCPNGTEFRPEAHALATRGVLVLGKVEPRKRQYELFTELRSEHLDIAFVGPIVDERVKSLLRSDVAARSAFTGPWDRGELTARLGEFKLLLLDSQGEADALVLYEAQLAGLEVLISPAARGAQDLSLPWIHQLQPEVPLAKQIAQRMQSQSALRADICDYAESRYRWDQRLRPLIRVLRSSSNPVGSLVSDNTQGSST